MFFGKPSYKKTEYYSVMKLEYYSVMKLERERDRESRLKKSEIFH